ncbi:alpha/beta fold hydrolase [Embleya sp. NPDC020886]|uniref:alpha/beta fold hydrolase n=1 Tax=Embleya sp. NPDC020886 TaxID=3363980 RepID=UPI0037ABBD63
MGRRQLVYVLPGIGGSVLEEPPSGKRPGRRVWDAGLGDIAASFLRPGRLDPDIALRPVGLITSKRLLGWTPVHGYERLIKEVGTGAVVDCGHPDTRNLAADVVLFPYDFRLSVVEAAHRLAADVHDRLKDCSEKERAGRVVVVAHSMGGLVARYWLGPLEGRRVCRSLVTLGTPHRGAPTALRWMVNGIPLRPGIGGPKGALTRWPSIAELLPQYPAVWDDSAQISLYPKDLPIEWLRSRAETGARTHADIKKAWDVLPRTTEMVPRVGWSHATDGVAHWDGKALRMTGEQPTWLDLAGREDELGDGTVPACSAVPQEMSGHNTIAMRVAEKHGPMSAAAWVAPMLVPYAERRPLDAVRGDRHKTTLGLDIDDVHAERSPLSVQVAIRGEDAPAGPPADVEVWATLRPADAPPGTPEIEMCLTADSTAGAYVGEFAGQPVGVYEITVDAEAVPGAGDLTARDLVAVVAP